MGRVRRLVPRETIEGRILQFRREKVMLDSDLAKLYGVPTRRLNEQVRRNRDRFPEDFMFQLTAEEARSLRSQDAASKPGRGGRRYAPLVFTTRGSSSSWTFRSRPAQTGPSCCAPMTTWSRPGSCTTRSSIRRFQAAGTADTSST